MKRILALLLAAVIAPSAFAWGEKGHYIVGEAATLGTTYDMPPFFYRAFPDLVWLAFEPDRWKGAGPSLDAVNPPDHFLDYEYAAGLQLPADRYKFIALMERSGRLRQHDLRNDEAGFLPWRIAEVTQQLQIAFRSWRTAQSPAERAYAEHDAIHLAGILGHYAGDSSNPHHATMNYNGWVSPNPHGYANDCGTHARFERDFVSHALDVADVVPKLAPPKLREDYFAAAVEAVRASNALVEPLYALDRDGAFDPMKPGSKEGVAFAADRLAAGASLLRDLWWSAWINSGRKQTRSGGD
ncbi:MAG TPA: hypothetical protein VF824_14970 [Thermoanaerobaculia bacterium]